MPTTTSPAPVKASVHPPPPGAAAARKALFWDRIAPKYAADPIADMAGYEATLQRVQGLLSAGQEVLDLDYIEDSAAGTDSNFVMTGRGKLIEVQMSAEGSTFSRAEMSALLDHAEAGTAALVTAQLAALA